MYAPLPYKSIACLVFTCLPLPAGLFGPTVCSAARLTLCGTDESLGFHSLYLVSSLGWLWAFSSLIQPMSPFTSSLWANWYSYHATALFLP